jgi:hypothetical protein
LEDHESLDYCDASASRTITTSICITWKFKNNADNNLVMVTAMETRRDQGNKNKLEKYVLAYSPGSIHS